MITHEINVNQPVKINISVLSAILHRLWRSGQFRYLPMFESSHGRQNADCLDHKVKKLPMHLLLYGAGVWE